MLAMSRRQSWAPVMEARTCLPLLFMQDAFSVRPSNEMLLQVCRYDPFGGLPRCANAIPAQSDTTATTAKPSDSDFMAFPPDHAHALRGSWVPPGGSAR